MKQSIHAPRGTRTPGLQVRNLSLYPLSYGRAAIFPTDDLGSPTAVPNPLLPQKAFHWKHGYCTGKRTVRQGDGTTKIVPSP